MKFCILSPVGGLERFATLSDHHLLLPQIRNQKYWQFYEKRRKEGDTIILDNGAYEGETDWKRLVECVQWINPQICSLPDYLLQDWKKTWHSASDFLDRYFYTFPNTEWMYIPQSTRGDIVGFINGLMKACEDPRIKWVGIPRALPLEITGDPFMRVRVAEHLAKHFPNIGVHCLGMAKGSVEEYHTLRRSNCVDSLDSNAPVWRGWNAYYLGDQWPEIPCDYNTEELFPHREEFIYRNLEMVNVDINKHRAGDRVEREAASSGADD